MDGINFNRGMDTMQTMELGSIMELQPPVKVVQLEPVGASREIGVELDSSSSGAAPTVVSSGEVVARVDPVTMAAVAPSAGRATCGVTPTTHKVIYTQQKKKYLYRGSSNFETNLLA